MRITVLPASSATSREAIRVLLTTRPSHLVTGVYRNPTKVPREFAIHPKFKASQGDLRDAASLDLAGSDAVLTLTPPSYKTDIAEFATLVATNVKAAIRNAGTVKRLVYLSSLGAQFSEGVVSDGH